MHEYYPTSPSHFRGWLYILSGLTLISASALSFALLLAPDDPIGFWGIAGLALVGGCYLAVLGLSPLLFRTPAVVLTKDGLVTLGPWGVHKRFFAWADLERIEVSAVGIWPFVHRRLIADYASDLEKPIDGEQVQIPVVSPLQFSLLLTRQNESEASARELLHVCENWRKQFGKTHLKLTAPLDIAHQRDRYLRLLFLSLAIFFIALLIFDARS